MEADTYELNERFYELCTRYIIKTLSTKTHPVNHLLSGIIPNNSTLKHGLQKCLEKLTLDNIPINLIQPKPTVQFHPSYNHKAQTDTSLATEISKNLHPAIQKSAAMQLIHDKYKN